MLKKLRSLIQSELNLEELADPARTLARIKRVWLFFSQTFRSIIRHQTMTIASALAFKTLMAIVPTLLIGIAVASAFGEEKGLSYGESFFQAIRERIPDTPALEPLLDLMQGIAQRSREIAGIGLLLLFFTAYSLLSSIEISFNQIWQVTGRRKMLNRAIAYLATVIVVPVIMSFSVYMNAKIETAARYVSEGIEGEGASISGLLRRLSEGEGENAPAAAPTQTARVTSPAPSTVVSAAETIDNALPATGDSPEDQQTKAKPELADDISAGNADVITGGDDTVTVAATDGATDGADSTNSAENTDEPTSGANEPPRQHIITKIILGLFSAVLTCLGLTLLFYFMPYTPVRWSAAIYGGIFSGVLVELTKYLFSFYAQYASTSLTRLYGSTLLALPLTLLWLWLIWCFVLLGAEVAFNLQNYRDLAVSAQIERKGLQYRSYLAVRIVLIASEYFNLGRKPLGFVDEAARRLGVPPFVVRILALELAEREVLREINGIRDGYLPARDLTELSVFDVTQAISGDTFATPAGAQDRAHAVISHLFGNAREAQKNELAHMSLHQLLAEEGFRTSDPDARDTAACC